MLSTKNTLDVVLSHFMEKAKVGSARLATLVNEVVGYELLTKRSVQNWRKGRVSRPQMWQPLIGIAAALRLNRHDTNLLLDAANHSLLSDLWLQADEKDRELLRLWKKIDQQQTEYHKKSETLPKQLPTREKFFLGRTADVDYFLDKLEPGCGEMLTGAGGIGKTALIAEVLNRLDRSGKLFERFPDGVILHDFYREPRAEVALENIVRAYGEEPSPTLALAAQRVLGAKRALLILDGAENADDLQTIMAIRGGCGLVIASRKNENVGFLARTLTPLSIEDSVALLRKWCGKRAADTNSVTEICKLVGQLPLALRLVGKQMARARINAVEILDLLREEGLEALDFGDRQKKSVRILLERSLDQVSEIGQQSLATIGLLAQAPFDAEAIASAFKLRYSKAIRLLGELAIHSLLERYEVRYEVAHALIHTYSRQYMQPLIPEDAVSRLATYFSILATEQNELKAAGYFRLNEDRPHFMTILTACTEYQNWREAKDFVLAVDNYFDMQGHWTIRIEALETGILASRKSNDSRTEAGFLKRLGNTFRQQGKNTEAIQAFEEALRIWQQLDDHHGINETTMDFANLYIQSSEWDAAIKLLEKALAYFRTKDNKVEEAKALSNLGATYRRQGKLSEALEFFEESLQVARESANHRGEIKALHNMGQVFIQDNRLDEAEAVFLKTREVFRELGDRPSEARALGSLGLFFIKTNQEDDAVRALREALNICQEIGDRYTEIQVWGALGDAYYSQRRWNDAHQVLRNALEIAIEINDRQGQGQALKKLGDVYSDREDKNLDQADRCYQEALKITQDLGNAHQEGVVLMEIGNLRSMSGDENEARKLWQEAKPKLRPTSSEYEQVCRLLQEN